MKTRNIITLVTALLLGTTILAQDADRNRLKPIIARLNRAGVRNAQVVPADEVRQLDEPYRATMLLRFVDGHDRSEVTGAAFDPSGTRMIVNSQRAPTPTTFERVLLRRRSPHMRAMSPGQRARIRISTRSPALRSSACR